MKHGKVEPGDIVWTLPSPLAVSLEAEPMQASNAFVECTTQRLLCAKRHPGEKPSSFF